MVVATLMCVGTLVFSDGVSTAMATDLAPLPVEVLATPPTFSPVIPLPVTVAAPAPAPQPPAFVVPTSPDQWFAPSGRNLGTEGLAMALAEIALQDNGLLYISDGWGRTDGPATSDHSISRTDSWAIDVAVRGIQQPTLWTETAASRVSTALGVTNWTGGDLTTTVNGYRFQILWKVAGHFNHVHVGVRKLSP